jgi:hypothetical protein
MPYFILLMVILFSEFSQAEYRVFTLKITNSKTQVSRTIKSTLDPEQYKSYYPLNNDEQISYVKTWRCRGSTRDFQALCEAPLSPQLTTPETSQNVQNKS